MAAAVTLDFRYLSEVLEDLSTDFFDDKNKQRYKEYIGYDILCNEFLRLKLPKGSDILNPAAGPGIVSARLQKEGYCLLDCLDVNKDNITNLMKTGLYRNYICRPVNTLNSTGIKDDIYDVIIMAGGFSPENIPPHGFNEFLRITKPDGHILFTLRDDYYHSDSEFGLLEENLNALEKEGSCKVMKAGENFTDSHSGLTGRLYVVVKTVSVSDFHPKGVPGTLPKLVLDSIQDPTYLDNFNPKYSNEGYTGAIKLCEAFFKLRLDRDRTEILDVSAHSENPGLVGYQLSMKGYAHLDGVDSDIETLKSVRAARIYRNYILGHVGEIGSIPVNDESYDVVLMAGGFAPGMILPLAFDELLRVLRPGGYILWTMRDGYTHDPDFALFDVRVNDLVMERKWELLVGPVFFPNFESGHSGRFYMLRKRYREIFALGSPRHSPKSSPSSSPSMKRRASASFVMK